MLKEIDLANKCGSCDHFRKIDGTAQGECLKNPYGENVVHDPKHPYWIVSRSRGKCRWYNAPPPTNADRIRAMNVEITKSCEDRSKTYVTFPDGLRLVFENGEYAGWYICGEGSDG